ncbi:MAG: hypothetical protein RL033_1358 [Pseudomonadota bacterium]
MDQNNEIGEDAVRITDSRYDRDLLRLAITHRMIALEARTRTIRLATQLSDDRIRRMYRDYFAALGGNRVRRRRGKSPRQMAYFRRSLDHEQQAALLGSLLDVCGLLVRSGPAFRPALEDVGRFCDVYETCLGLWTEEHFSFEHAWYLWQVYCRDDEFVLADCPDCGARWLQDTLEILPYNCSACRRHPPVSA